MAAVITAGVLLLVSSARREREKFSYVVVSFLGRDERRSEKRFSSAGHHSLCFDREHMNWSDNCESTTRKKNLQLTVK